MERSIYTPCIIFPLPPPRRIFVRFVICYYEDEIWCYYHSKMCSFIQIHIPYGHLDFLFSPWWQFSLFPSSFFDEYDKNGGKGLLILLLMCAIIEIISTIWKCLLYMCHVGPFKMLLYANYRQMIVDVGEKRVSKFSISPWHEHDCGCVWIWTVNWYFHCSSRW